MAKRARKTKTPLSKSVRLWLPTGVAVFLLAIGAVALVVGQHVLKTKAELEAAIPLASTVQQQLIAGDQGAAAQTAASLRSRTEAAATEASGKLWRGLEWVPVAGPNLHAVRVASVAVNDIAVHAVGPATELSLDKLKPVHGRIDLGALDSMTGTMRDATASIERANLLLATVHTNALLAPVRSGIGQLEASLAKADGLLGRLDSAVKVLPDALGADGPRNYLMLFQNNAEARGTGGNPAAIVLLTADDGKISITQQASSQNFKNGRAEPIITLDPATEKLYGDKIGRYMQDITLTPDFPYTAKLAKAFWASSFDTKIDGVVSFDPVALSYLLKATGPVALPTGDILTSENAVRLLLNQVYFRYEDPKMQDAFFASAAASVFDALTTGGGDTKTLVTQLLRATHESRFLYWSEGESEQELIAGTRMTGTLPEANADTTVVGAYINDITGSKMDYYLNVADEVTSTQCQAEKPAFRGSVSLTSTVDPAKAGDLPLYITGPYFHPGNISTDVVLYGPVGAKIDAVTLDGKKAKIKSSAEHLGRPAVKINVLNKPGTTHTISYTMTGAAGKYGPLELRHTPMVRQTPVTVSTPGCS